MLQINNHYPNIYSSGCASRYTTITPISIDAVSIAVDIEDKYPFYNKIPTLKRKYPCCPEGQGVATLRARSRAKSRLSPNPLSFGNRPTTVMVYKERNRTAIDGYIYPPCRCEDRCEPFLIVSAINVSTDGILSVEVA